MSIVILLFWISAALLVWTYAGYPLAIYGLARLRARQLAKSPFTPHVSIVVIARNEEAIIARKVKNLLALQYPVELLEIVIASDASTDATVQQARECGEHRIRVVEFDRHRGKPAVLNDLMPSLAGEIVVLMDARQLVNREAVWRLVDNFADPSVGAVGGELLLLTRGNAAGAADGVGVYWHYEKFIRRHESRCDSTVGVSGALYALRRQLYQPIPQDTILDDVLIPMQVVRQGYRVLFEPLARASDRVSATATLEFQRKVRTIAGNYQLFCHHPWLLNPWQNRLWMQTVSHKLCRLLSPVCLLLALVTSALLATDWFYGCLLLLQLLFYAAALAGALSPRMACKWAWCSVPHAFCLLNWSAVVGLVRFVRGTQRVTWQQTS